MSSSVDVDGALSSALQGHVDEDTYEYISSLLQDDPFDDDAREAVTQMVVSAVEDEDGKDGMAIFRGYLKCYEVIF